MLVFLHLSDIHFTERPRSSPHEIDEQIRIELRHDAVEQCNRLGGASALLISGDIADKGQTSEYAKAADWLTELCAALDIGSENVWVIPGNHDVDRSAHGALHDALRTELEGIDLGRLDEKLAELLLDKTSSELVNAPFKPYFEFARRYKSLPLEDAFFWENEIRLDDSLAVRLRGMNSAVVSDGTDEEKKPRLVLGASQTQIQRRPGVIHLAMCHHPPDWVRDESAIGTVHANAALFLTGHNHHSEVLQKQNCLWVAAGALHPPRKEEEWKPHYNVITFDLISSDTQPEALPKVEICIYPRTFIDARFTSAISPRQRDCRVFDIDEVAAQALDNGPIGAPAESYENQPPDSEVTRLADRRLRLRHRYNELLDGARREIAKQFGFSLAEIQEAGPVALGDFLIERAAASGQLAELWSAVEKGHNQPDRDNPYREDDA